MQLARRNTKQLLLALVIGLGITAGTSSITHIPAVQRADGTSNTLTAQPTDSAWPMMPTFSGGAGAGKLPDPTCATCRQM
jgi:hypothetical protein